MTNRSQIRRALLLLIFLGAAFAGLGYRLVDLQVFRHDELSRLAERNTEREIWQPATRGDILDAKGNVLATSVPVKTVWVNPAVLAGQKLLANPQAVFANVLAPVLQLDRTKLFEQMQPRIHKNSKGEMVTNQYAVLKRQVSEDDWQKALAALKTIPALVEKSGWKKSDLMALTNLCAVAVAADADEKRVYPNGSLAAQVLGFVGSQETTNHTSNMFGCDGIERAFNSKLIGVDGWRVTQDDRSQRELVGMRDEDVTARDGLNVVLTIDARVQDIVETELARAMKEHEPAGITGIVMRPRTGEILAMASLPNFDPNNMRAADTNALRNRVISDMMEPGSTFKTIVISGALNERVVSLNDMVFCEDGVFHYAGLTLHDSEGHHFGNLPVWQVLQKSSNIGASKIGIKMQAPMLHDYMTAFGLGAFTGIPLPHEANTSLYLPKLDALEKRKYLLAQVPMGQGVAVTRLQMTMAIGAIANDGVLMCPMLVKGLADHGANLIQKYEPQSVRRVISSDTARQMVGALKTVVSKGGTAEFAAIPNYVVAGKTGTAEKTEAGHVGYVQGKYVVSFIGFFPADNPQICISIVMDAPKEGGHAFGGALCGPVFSRIGALCASYLNIPPDQNLITNTPPLVAEVRTRKIQNP